MDFQHNSYFKLTNPTIKENDGVWYIRVNDQELLNFKVSKNGKSITDDLGVTYTLDEN